MTNLQKNFIRRAVEAQPITVLCEIVGCEPDDLSHDLVEEVKQILNNIED